MDSNQNTLKILKSINNLKRYFINIGETIKGLENLDLSEVAKQGENKEATNSKIYDILNEIKGDWIDIIELQLEEINNLLDI